MATPITWRNVGTQNQAGNIRAVGEGGAQVANAFNQLGSSLGQVATNEQANTARIRKEATDSILNSVNSLNQEELAMADSQGAFSPNSLSKQGFSPDEVSTIMNQAASRGSSLESSRREGEDYAFKINQRNRTIGQQDRADAQQVAGDALNAMVLNNAGQDFQGDETAFANQIRSNPAYAQASPEKRATIIEEGMQQFNDIRKMNSSQQSQYQALQAKAKTDVDTLTQDHQAKLKSLAEKNGVGLFSGSVEDPAVQLTIKDINERDDGEGLQIYGQVTDALGFAPSGEIFQGIVARGRQLGDQWFTSESGGLEESIQEYAEKSGKTELNTYLRDKVGMDKAFTRNVDAANAVPSKYRSQVKGNQRKRAAGETVENAQAGSFNLGSALATRTPQLTTPTESAPEVNRNDGSFPSAPEATSTEPTTAQLDLGRQLSTSGTNPRNKNERDALKAYQDKAEKDAKKLLKESSPGDAGRGAALALLGRPPSHKKDRDLLKAFNLKN